LPKKREVNVFFSSNSDFALFVVCGLDFGIKRSEVVRRKVEANLLLAGF